MYAMKCPKCSHDAVEPCELPCSDGTTETILICDECRSTWTEGGWEDAADEQQWLDHYDAVFASENDVLEYLLAERERTIEAEVEWSEVTR